MYRSQHGRPLPYIGITGLSSHTETRAVLDGINTPPGRLTMIGVLNSQNKNEGKPPKFPARYPELSAIKEIFTDDSDVLNLIHYATRDQATLAEQLSHLIRIGGANLHGLQLNMAWPKPSSLEAASRSLERIVLQIGYRALETGGQPDQVSARLKEYQGFITDILFDMSGGKGIPLNPSLARPYLERISADHPALGIGIAGGLSATTLHLAEPIIKDFQFISVDIEGRVREEGTDRLIIEEARKYRQGMNALLNR